MENGSKILDIGTGSGAIPIALKKENDSYKITSVDISQEALVVAKRNAELNDVKIDFFQSDLFSNVNEKFDCIVSNPPYISDKEYNKLQPEVNEYEPKIALTAQENGLYFYRKILEDADDFILENGKIYFEIGQSQAQEIKKIADDCKFEVLSVLKDLNNFDRIMILRKRNG